MIDVPAILQQHGSAVGAYLTGVLSRQGDAPQRLLESIDYSLSAGGKRLRPALLLECFHAVKRAPSASHAVLDASASAMAAAAAMELIHTFSLVHDDLPAMDDDDTRRGKPTNHKVFGEGLAILAGDAMMTLAFEVLALDADPTLLPRLVRELAHASGPSGMIGGQVLDMAGENKLLELPQLQQIHRMKTGALLTASCRLGAICGRASDDELEAITLFGRHLGMAFQIVDDILDETSTPEQLGKATGKDRSKGKNTYPHLLGLAQSQEEAATHMSLAIAALEPFGDRGNSLAAMAAFVVTRTT
jgi:geranylgeranyl diphosphate synthase type II